MRPRIAGGIGALAVAAALGLSLRALAAPSDDLPPPPKPDLFFFLRHVVPILDAKCASCHRNGAGGFALPAASAGVPEERRRRAEFKEALRHLDALAPWRSRLIVKALPESEGGVPHAGGALLSTDAEEYDTLLDFASGATLVNLPPEPEPGKDRRARPGEEILLDGSLSYDRDNEPVTFRWDLSVRPVGSRATLSGDREATAKFTADVPGTYVARLRVFDGKVWSPPKPVTVEALDRVGPEAPDPVAESGLAAVDPGALGRLRAVFAAVLSRPPTPPEAIALADKPPLEVARTLLATVEAGRAWVEETAQSLGLVGEFARSSETVEALPARIAAGQVSPGEAEAVLTGDRAAASPEFRAAAMRRHVARFLPPDSAAAFPAARASESIPALTLALLSSPEYAALSSTPRPPKDLAFVRAAFADLLGRRPTAREAAACARACAVLPGSRAGRAAIVNVLLDSGEVPLPLVVDVKDPDAWIRDRFLRFLGRVPATEEMNAYRAAWMDPDGGPHVVVRAILSTPEYLGNDHPAPTPAATVAGRCERVVLVMLGGVRTKDLLGRPDLMPAVQAIARTGFAVPGWAVAGSTHEDAVLGLLCGRTVPPTTSGDETRRDRAPFPTVLEYARKGLSLPMHAVWFASYADGSGLSVAASDHADFGTGFSPALAYGEGPFGEALRPLFAMFGRPNPTSPRTWDLLARLRGPTAKEAMRQERALLAEVDTGAAAITGPNALDARAIREGISVLKLFRPRLLVVRLGQADVAHSDLFGYWEVLKRNDAEIARLRAEIAADPALAGTTALLLVPELGRNAEQNALGGLDHDDGSPDATTVAVVGEGPGFRHVTSLKRPLALVDLCPTLGRLLGFPTPFAEGSARDDLLAPPR